jgi:hypothetical protein
VFTIDEYLERVPAEHRDKPKFKATLTNILQPNVRVNTLLEDTAKYYDLDSAIGTQLTTVGEWIGRNRQIKLPIEKPWFSFDDTAAKGWDSGLWFGAYDSEYGIVDADDDTYRLLLRLQILLNTWDGTAESLLVGFQKILPDCKISIKDNFDMSADISVDVSDLGETEKEIVSQTLPKFQPVGVTVNINITR